MVFGFVLVVAIAAPAVIYGQTREACNDALARYKAKDFSGALRVAEEALRLKPGNASCRHVHGMALARLGRLAEAQSSLAKAVQSDPKNPDLNYDLAFVLSQDKKYDDAVPVLQKAVELAPGNLQARFLLGLCYISNRRKKAIPNFGQLALDQFQEVAAKRPNFPTVHQMIGRIHLSNGDAAAAMQAYNTELALYPANSQARAELGELFLKAGEPAKALEQLLLAREGTPDLPELHYLLAKVYRELGRAGDAMTSARLCAKLAPEFPDVHYVLAQLHGEAGDLEAAAREAERFEELKKAAASHPPD